LQSTTIKKISQGLCLLVCMGLCATGCQSLNSSSDDNLCSVTITNKSTADVTSAIRSVFTNHGFTGGQTGPDQFTYERPGSEADNLAYGNYFFGEKVTVRVVVTLTQTDASMIQVACNAALVEAEGDMTAQDTYKVHQLGKRPYEDLLKDIQTQLGE
jgi:hypothetical protein